MRYHLLSSLLLNELQKLQRRVAGQEARIERLERQLLLGTTTPQAREER